ncbi:hypothetical protein D3C71_2073420 [compost metagenome]
MLSQVSTFHYSRDSRERLYSHQLRGARAKTFLNRLGEPTKDAPQQVTTCGRHNDDVSIRFLLSFCQFVAKSLVTIHAPSIAAYWRIKVIGS